MLKKKEGFLIVVGLTGGIGSGKSAISKHLKNKKIPVFDSDAEVNRLYLSKDPDLIKTIGKITKTQPSKRKRINKNKLGDLVFDNPKKLKILEKVIFKKLNLRRKNFLKKNKEKKEKIVFLDTPLLFENKINHMCDYVMTTKTPLKKRLNRVLKRPGMTITKAKKIMAKQLPEIKKIKLADFVVQTDMGKWYTKRKINKIIKKILEKK